MTKSRLFCVLRAIWWRFVLQERWYMVKTVNSPSKPVIWNGYDFEDRLGIVSNMDILKIRKAI